MLDIMDTKTDRHNETEIQTERVSETERMVEEMRGENLDSHTSKKR